jgi:hypothetical protein
MVAGYGLGLSGPDRQLLLETKADPALDLLQSLIAANLEVLR